MSNSRGLFRPLFAITCIALTALGLRNTYADNSAEKKLAEQIACKDPGCSTNLLSESRSAIGQSFAFQITSKRGGSTQSAGVVNVECSRELIFVGAYSCQIKP